MAAKFSHPLLLTLSAPLVLHLRDIELQDVSSAVEETADGGDSSPEISVNELLYVGAWAGERGVGEEKRGRDEHSTRFFNGRHHAFVRGRLSTSYNAVSKPRRGKTVATQNTQTKTQQQQPTSS